MSASRSIPHSRRRPKRCLAAWAHRSTRLNVPCGWPGIHSLRGNSIAQCYRDAGKPWDAFQWYEKRAAMTGWDEETWHAKYQMAQMMRAMGVGWEGLIPAYLEAYALRPSRLEPLLPLATYYREKGDYELGFMFSRAWTEKPYPDDYLFIERAVYDYQLPTEYAICCYWLGKHAEAIRVNEHLLERPELPDNYRQSAERNLRLSLEALEKATVGESMENEDELSDLRAEEKLELAAG